LDPYGDEAPGFPALDVRADALGKKEQNTASAFQGTAQHTNGQRITKECEKTPLGGAPSSKIDPPQVRGYERGYDMSHNTNQIDNKFAEPTDRPVILTDAGQPIDQAAPSTAAGEVHQGAAVHPLVAEARAINALLARKREEMELPEAPAEDMELDESDEFEPVPQYRIDIDSGRIDIFDPEGPYESCKRAKELQLAAPTAGDLAELITANIIIKAIQTGPGSDAFELMWWDGQIYRPGADKLIASCVQTIMGRRTKKELVNETIAYIERMRQLCAVPPERGNLVCVQNGVLNLDTGELGAHRPDLVFTSALPVRYDPSAEAHKISKFLREVLDPEPGTSEDGELLDFCALMEFLGTCLEPGYKWQKGAIFVGSGANGKSVLLNLITAFLGPENVSSVSMEELGGGDKYAAADLVGKKANICADISSKELRDTATLKKALGGDAIHAQRKYGHPFSFVNEAKMFFSCNAIPRSDDLSLGWTRRWLIFQFPRSFSKDDANPHLLDELTDPRELSGLLNLALEGRRRLREQGYFTGHDDMEKDRERYLKLSNPSTSFLAKRCYLQPTEIFEDGIRSPIPETEVTELYLAYVDWCKAERLVPETQQKFGKVVPQVFPGVSKVRKWKGDRRKDATYVWVWVGLGLYPS